MNTPTQQVYWYTSIQNPIYCLYNMVNVCINADKHTVHCMVNKNVLQYTFDWNLYVMYLKIFVIIHV